MRVGRVVITGSLSLVTAFAGLVAVADVAVAAPTTRYVAPTGNDDENDCSAPATPCRTIQQAVDSAAAGDTVSLVAGEYAGGVGIDKSVTLVGPGSGTATITGGEGFGLLATGDTTVLALSRVTVSGNDGFGIGAQDGAAVTVTDSTLTRNTEGGLISLGGAGVTVVRSSISGNGGGGLIVIATTVSVTDSVVSDNAVGSDEDGFGFGIVAFGASLQVVRSTVSGNAIGGIITESDTGIQERLAAAAPALDTTITDSTVSGNVQVGIAAQGGTVGVDRSTVSGNGLGVYAALSAVTVRNSTIAATSKYAYRGSGAPTSAGLYFENRSMDAARVAAKAPAFLPRSSRLTLGTRTLTVRPQAQRRAAAAPAGITVSGSVLDQAGTVPDCAGGPVTDAGYNLSADAANSCGLTSAKHDVIKTAAALGALRDNGGSTLTHLPAVGSPAIDVVPSGRAGCVAGATDQRGVGRPIGARCDLGAVEAPIAPVRITTRTLPDGQVGEKYAKTLAATGGDGDYAWSLAAGSARPDGLRLSRAGVVSGTPTKAGTTAVTVLADGASRRFTLEIAAADAAPAGNGDAPIANTGVPSGQLTAWGSALVLLGLFVLLAAGNVGRRPGRHRPTA